MAQAGEKNVAPALEARDLTLSWDGEHVIVQDVDVTVAPGEVCCLVGRSGCGKTTILHALAGLTTAEYFRDQGQDVLLPRKRRYYIESLYSHYAHTHYGEHLDVTREIIEAQCPQYLPAFDRVMRRTWGHMFNMFVMKGEKCDAYCAWLFPILEQLEGRVDYRSLDPFQARLFGRVSELLLDVWLETNGYAYQELPLVSTEPVNWWKKGTSFLKAKFSGKKYGSSF